MSLLRAARFLDNFEAFVVFFKLDFQLGCFILRQALPVDLYLLVVEHVTWTLSHPLFPHAWSSFAWLVRAKVRGEKMSVLFVGSALRTRGLPFLSCTLNVC